MSPRRLPSRPTGCVGPVSEEGTVVASIGMRRVSCAIAVCVVMATACGRSGSISSAPSEPPRPAVHLGQFEVDGQTRTYRVFAPPTIDGDAPAALLLALHDAFGTADSFREATQLDRAAASGNFVVVYPESLVGTWNAGFCCGRAVEEEVNDLGFLMRLLDEVGRMYTVDEGRVYAAGASNGAIMAYQLGCELADRVAGVASVGGAMVMDRCAPSEPVSVLAIHGTEDGHVPYAGGPTSGAPGLVPSQPALLDRWGELNGCAQKPQSETAGVVTTATWTGCAAGKSVRLVTVDGAGHSWFSAEFGGAAGAVDATDLVTEFFDLTAEQ